MGLRVVEVVAAVYVMCKQNATKLSAHGNSFIVVYGMGMDPLLTHTLSDEFPLL